MYSQEPPKDVIRDPLAVAWQHWKGKPPRDAIAGWLTSEPKQFRAWDPLKGLFIELPSTDHFLRGYVITGKGDEDGPSPSSVFAMSSGWSLVYSLKQPEGWLWIETKAESVESWVHFICEDSSMPLPFYIEVPNGRWNLCRGGLQVLPQLGPSINDYNRLVSSRNNQGLCTVMWPNEIMEPWVPGFVQPKINKPIFNRSKSTPAEWPDNFVNQCMDLIKRSKQLKKAIIFPIAVSGDWIKVLPAKYEKGIWEVNTDEGDYLFLQWDITHIGWIKWRSPGPVPGAYYVHITN